MGCRVLYFLLISTLSCHLTFAQSEVCNDNGAFRKKIESGFDAIYNNDLAGASVISKRLKAECPNNPQSHLFEATYLWWHIISGDDGEENYEKMEASLDRALSKLSSDKKAKNLSNEEIHNTILIYAYKSRIKMFQGKYIRAVQNLNSCVGMVELSFGRENEFDLFKLTSGLYNYFIEFGYEYSVLARAYLIFLPSGDKEKGLNFLKEASKSKDFIIKTEAHYFLMKIYGETEEQPKLALGYAKELVNDYPNNLLFRYYLHKIMLQLNMSTGASEHLKALQMAEEKKEPNAAHFLKLAQEDYNIFYAKKNN